MARWLSWSPDEVRIATGAAKIWNTETGQELLSPGGYKVRVMRFWHPDGQRLITAEDAFDDGACNKYLLDARIGYAAEQQVTDPDADNTS